MLAFWDSIADLRRIELILLVVTMVVPFLCGSLLLSIRHRVKTLQTQSSESQGFTYQDHAQNMDAKIRRLETDLKTSQKALSALRPMVAPREMTDAQANIFLEKLQGVKASPVIVAAYAFEEESAAYAAQIAAALRKAGWDVTLRKSSMNDFKGISLGTVNLMHRPLTGQHELAEAFTAAHMDLHQREIVPDSIAGSLQDGSLLVVVGRK